MRDLINTRGTVAVSGFLNDVIHDRLTFGTNGGGASVIEPKEFKVFITEVGGKVSNISTGETLTQTDSDTSLEGNGGTIANGEFFVITSIGINVHLSNVQATSPREDDTITSIDVTPLFRVNPIPLYDAIMSQCTFELYRNSNERLEKGNISEYPSSFGNHGFAGGSGASVPALAGGNQNAYSVNPTVYINGSGRNERPLTVYNELAPNDQFRGSFKVSTEIDLASTLLVGWIDFYMVGRALNSYERSQWFLGLPK